MTWVTIFLLAFAALVAQALLRRRMNPYEEIPYEELPGTLRSEIERVLPGFCAGRARLTRGGDEARLEGAVDGEPIAIEADFDPSGALLDLEIDTRCATRHTGIARPEDLPEAARRELERVLGTDLAEFETSRVTRGQTREGTAVFEVKGRSGDWKWEVELTAEGRLLELEREKRLRRR